MRQFVVERIERLRANGGGDIVTELFRPLPAMVIADYLGVPEADRSHFDGWAEAIGTVTTAEGGLANALKNVIGPLATMMGYFTTLIKLRRRVPGDDTVSQLVMTGLGADGDAAGMQSVLAFVFAMIANGIDTTTGMLGGSVQLLHQRPDQRKLLVENPGLIPASVDEFLRLTSPGTGDEPHHHPRRQDLWRRDSGRSPGAVAVRLGQSRRTPVWRRRRRLDVQRQPRNIVAFSQGVNRCLGAAAARLQSRVVLTELLTRCPDFVIDEPGITWAGSSHVRRPLSLPFRVRS